jgi:hypothetical protein
MVFFGFWKIVPVLRCIHHHGDIEEDLTFLYINRQYDGKNEKQRVANTLCYCPLFYGKRPKGFASESRIIIECP